jgi:hypothetical protein
MQLEVARKPAATGQLQRLDTKFVGQLPDDQLLEMSRTCHVSHRSITPASTFSMT